MNCDAFRERVWDFPGGSLSDCAEFERHRLECPSCAAALEAIAGNEEILRQAWVPPAPADLWPRIARETAGVSPLRWPRWAVAAALLMGIGAIALGELRRAPAPMQDIVIEDVEGDLGVFVPSYEDGLAAVSK